MAEPTDSDASAPEQTATDLTRRNRERRTPRSRAARPVARTVAASAPVAASARPRSGSRPVRSAVIFTMVVGLIATVALPAYAAFRPEAETKTLQQAAAADAQSLVVASDATVAQLDRSSYSATTSEEIDKKKAAEAAAERARQVAAAARTTSTSSSANSTNSTPIDLSMTAPGSGEVRWPIQGFTKGRGLWDSGYHQGVDLLASCGTPLFAAAAGVVRVSQESFGGYGVAVTIDHVINGQRVSTLYGHMTYGSRQVQSGQTVEAGQLIGVVGSTGSSTACHLHFEVHINNAVVDPWAWLEQNAG
ncbi:M23 family metallopeptidase [Microbacterium sp. AG1240]|uniref:M23 family metallopeptidase n=1 Tax=Microbacterium sp. AG1240 TaxID=2183992 RepID=UPI00217E8085|nr:M23 family metallopeptidase [Microbacterium sp. AG1240]